MLKFGRFGGEKRSVFRVIALLRVPYRRAVEPAGLDPEDLVISENEHNLLMCSMMHGAH